MLLDRTLKFLLKQFRGNSFVFVRTIIISYADYDDVMISANAIASVVDDDHVGGMLMVVMLARCWRW